MSATQTAGSPDYFVVIGTVAGIAAFNAAVLAKRNLGWAPIGNPYTDGVDIEQVMFKGAISSFIGVYPIIVVAAVATSGYQTLSIAPARVGTDSPGLAAATYDFDITIDGGVLQQESIVIAGGEDYDAIAALMDAEVTPAATVVFSGSAFVFTSASTGVTSTILVAAGTAGSGGGDLFAAIEVADTVTITFNAPVAGTAGTVDAFTVDGDQAADFQAGYRFTVSGSTGNDGTYTVAPNGSILLAGPTTQIPTVEQIPDATADGDIVAYAAAANQANPAH